MLIIIMFIIIIIIILDDEITLTTVPLSTDDEWMIQAKGEIEIEKNVNRATTGL